jgi:phosphoribosylformylglycinamidine (FGAM) synthase PurS component
MNRYIFFSFLIYSFLGCNNDDSNIREFQSLNVEEINIKYPENWIRKYNDKAILAFKLDSSVKYEYFIIMKTLISPELKSVDNYLCKKLKKSSNSNKYDLLGTSYHKVQLKNGLSCFVGHELTKYQKHKYISLNVITQIDSFYYEISLNSKESDLEKYSQIFNTILANLVINKIKINQSEVIQKIKIKTDSICNDNYRATNLVI